MNDPLETLLEEFDSYDCDELLSDTNYDNSHLTNQDEFDWEIYEWVRKEEIEYSEQENEKAKEK